MECVYRTCSWFDLFKEVSSTELDETFDFGVPNDPDNIIAHLVQFKHGTSPPSSCLILILRRLQQYEFMI